jgi:protein-L-isoaspartate(D-aspartate) O-methyltransferase
MSVDFAAARRIMVESQLRTNKVTDLRVLEGFSDVPREDFVAEAARGVAYLDEDIALGGGRFLTESLVLARMIQAAAIGAGDIVLEIGSATGYGTAILARLAATVVALESDSQLSARAAATLSELSIDNVVAVEGPLPQGYPEQAPYNVILINGAVAEVPQGLQDQLADGGRLIAVVRDRPGLGRAVLVQRLGAVASSRVLFDAGTPLLPGFERAPRFAF